MLLAAIASLGAVVTFLWKQISDNHRETREARDECEEDRKRLWQALYQIHPASKELNER